MRARLSKQSVSLPAGRPAPAVGGRPGVETPKASEAARRAASRRRVLIYCVVQKADRGGVQAAVLSLADGLRAAGHEVLLAWPDGDATAGEASLPLCVDLAADPRAALASAGRSVRDLWRLARVIGRFGPDVVNIHFPRSQALYFLVLRAAYGYRLVLSFHGSDAYFAAGASRRSLPVLMRGAAGITAVSASVKTALTEMAPGSEGKVEVVRNGIDDAFWAAASGAERDPHHLIAAGRLVPVKGFDVLLEAVAACRGQGLPVRLTLFGDGPEGPALKGQAVRLGLDGAVSFAGHAEPEALRAAYAEAGVFVLSSRSEGLPLALLEAMAAGLVPVCTDAGGVDEVLGAEAWPTVPPDDPAALAGAIEAAVTGWRKEASEAARRRASSFSMRTQHARMSELIEGL